MLQVRALPPEPVRHDMLMAYTVYVLINPAGNTYVGQTRDLSRRIGEHNDLDFRGTLHTKRWPGPWTILHQESFGTRADAMAREKALKTGKGRDFIRTLKPLGC